MSIHIIYANWLEKDKMAVELGNIYGGKTADKTPDPDKLYGRILIDSL